MMSNTQLYFAIGIPSILVILSWVTTLMQNNRLDAKLDRVAEGIRSDARADRKELIERLDKLSDRIHTELQAFFKTICEIDSRVNRIEEKP